MRKSRNLSRSLSETIDHFYCVLRRGVCNERSDVAQLSTCCGCPVHLHSDKPNSARTSSTLVFRPLRLSANPFSIASRTYISYLSCFQDDSDGRLSMSRFASSFISRSIVAFYLIHSRTVTLR